MADLAIRIENLSKLYPSALLRAGRIGPHVSTFQRFNVLTSRNRRFCWLTRCHPYGMSYFTIESEEVGKMLIAYIQEALERARYELIEDEEPYYGEVPELAGVWATGKTLEACRRNLAEAIEDWVLFSIAKGLPIPALGQVAIHLPEKIPA